MNWEDFDRACELQRKENNKLLVIFEEDLRNAGLKQNTIKKHIDNVDFYINDFLFREEPFEIKSGCGIKLEEFLGYYFIHKCMWSTPATVKTTAASIKKFYKCMLEKGYIGKAEYEELCDTIKENMEEWQKECKRFNSY